MIQGVNNDYDYHLSTIATSTNSISTTKNSESEKNAQGTRSAKTDTIEISEQARAAMEQASSIVSVGGKASSEDDTEAEANAAASQSATVQTNFVSTAASSSAEADTAPAVTAAATNSAVSSSVATKAPSTVVATSTDSSSSSENLTVLTQGQMDDLVSQGAITQAQENTELARRTVDKQPEQATQVLTKAQSDGIESYKKQILSIGIGTRSITEEALNSVA